MTKRQILNNRLKQFFGFKTETNPENKKVKVSPIDKKSGKPINLSTRAQKLWDWYLSETNDKLDTLSNRLDRYKDIDYMLYNETLASFTVDLYADEIAQADDQFNLIQVTAKNAKIEKRIKQLLEQWGIDQEYIRDVGYNLVAYGDSFDIDEIDEKEGIISVTPVGVREITQRLEFKLSEAERAQSISKYSDFRSSASIASYISSLEDEQSEASISKSYLSYLFGFVVKGGSFVYPWQVTHYRLNSKRSEFFPYGRSLLTNLIGPYRQLKASMSLMTLTRAMKFPKEIYKVQTSDEMTAAEKWDAVNSAKVEFQNSGVLSKTKDDFAIGDELWLPNGLLDHEVIDSNLRVEDIADIELLRDNFIIGTKVPKGYLIADNSGWGTSGQSLLQQSKPFGRAVYTCQSAILKGISDKIRTHFLITGEFEKEFTEFQISLNYPVVEEASDRQRMKSDSIKLASDIIDNIETAMGLRNATLPSEVVKDLFSKFSFLDADVVNSIVDALASQTDQNESTEAKNQTKRLTEKYNRLNEDIISTALFESLKKYDIKECYSNGRHYYTSSAKFLAREYKEEYKMFRTINKIEKLED